MHKPSSTTLIPPTPPKLPQPLFSRLGLYGWRLPLLLVIGFVAWQGGSWWRALAPYELPVMVALSELGSPVGISRDDLSIPTIRAQSERDAYVALGFLHAHDRLWSMELMRRIAAGRLSEVVGPKALPIDRFMRTLNLRDSARKSFPKLDAEVRTALRLYAAGVNAWIAQGHLAPEFTVLGYPPEPWQETDSLLVADLLATQLMSDWRDGLLQVRLFTLLGEQARDLWPHTSSNAVLAGRHSLSPALAAIVPPDMEPRTASNVWAVNGSHTASGKPLLANDTHLRFTEVPVVWHLSTVLAPTLTVSGATIPGLPFHLVAHNDRMAWGITVAHADIADLVVERSDDGQHWHSTTGPKPFVWRDEVIGVKGEADHILKVRSTDHGPVISDLQDHQDPFRSDQIVSLQTALFRGDNLSLRALYILNRAADITSARQALADAQAPVLNFALASVDGDIALQTVGRVPLRHPDNDGIFPTEGWRDAAAWQGFIPYAEMPVVFNPPSGMIANTNNAVARPDYPHRISPPWLGEARARRLQELLNAAPQDMTWEDMAVLQGDTVSVVARDLLPRLLAVGPSDSLPARLLQGWDGSMNKDTPQPLIFHAWVDALWLAMTRDRLKDMAPYLRTPRQPALLRMLDHPQNWCGADSCDSQIAAALATATDDLTQRFGSDPHQWRWGTAHRGHLHNPVLEKIPLLSVVVNLVFPMDGDDATLNRGTFHPETYAVVQAAALRTIFDLNDLWQSRFILASGQSGHPLSPHYRDQLPLWQANRTTPLHAPQQRTLLKPKR